MGFVNMLIFKDSINKNTNFWHRDRWELHSEDIKTIYDVWKEQSQRQFVLMCGKN